MDRGGISALRAGFGVLRGSPSDGRSGPLSLSGEPAGEPYSWVMDAAWIARARWRWRGAWMWPAFVAMAIADGVIGHALPINPPSQSVVAGIVVGLVLNL